MNGYVVWMNWVDLLFVRVKVMEIEIGYKVALGDLIVL